MRKRLWFAGSGLLAAVVLAVVGALVVRSGPAVSLTTRPGDGTAGCHLMLVQGWLHGDRSSDPHVWLDVDGHPHVPIMWPAGYTGRFNPQLEILNDHGRVVARDGDFLSVAGDSMTACVPDGALGWPLPLRRFEIATLGNRNQL